MKRVFAGIVGLLFLTSGGHAEPRAPEVSEAFERDVRRLIEITRTHELGLRIGRAISQQMYNALVHSRPDLPDRAYDVMDEVAFELFQSETDSLVDEMVPLYVEHYSHEEVRELIRFYESPIGRKSLEVTPTLMNEAWRRTQVWSRSVHPKLEPLVFERFKREEILPPDAERLFGGVQPPASEP